MEIYSSQLKKLLLIACCVGVGQLPLVSAVRAEVNNSNRSTIARSSANNILRYKLIVNSNSDNTQPQNGGLTLREAIEIINGKLTIDRLAASQRAQVQELGNNQTSRIEFALPAGQTKIALTRELPAISVPRVEIDGSTQAGFSPVTKTGDRIVMPTPVVEITPADNISIARGISIGADEITIKGLSIYGFHAGNLNATQNIPAGDIFIAPQSAQINNHSSIAPKNISIEGNYLGIKPDKTTPDNPSDFGVYIFNSIDTKIKNNTINNHTASGIITAIKADNLTIEENAIIGNGNAGMPDAIRLEGEIRNNTIKTNLICANDGSGVFIFKPQIGAANITNNTIKYNGRRLRRAAVHLMGNDNRVSDNYIAHQTGAGVSVSAFAQPHSPTGDTTSARNIVRGNRFAALEGTSIDLLTQGNVEVENFQDGDGINPDRNSDSRRRDTGNMAIDAPKFLAREFLLLEDKVYIDGTAEPGVEVELYRVTENTDSHGPLSQPLGTYTADSKGRFRATLSGLAAGTRLSAIATLGKYGTSEPARNAIVTDTAGTNPALTTSPDKPECYSGDLTIPSIANPKTPTIAQTPPPTVPETPAPTPAPAPAPIPEKIKLSIPANVHFALDKSDISPRSGAVIKQIATVLKEHPYIVIDLEGHTDPRANNDYNQRLGLRRARSTRNYLVSQGIAPERITIRSYGETKLKTPRTNILDYARNRRVEFFYRDVRGVELEIIEQDSDLQLER
jgi:outer membrane protein OmpA-like peptidoglycan-associated protein